MRKSLILVFIISLFFTGCSTMVSPKKTSVFIESDKKGQLFIVKDNKGKVVAKAKTPAVIKLDNKGDSTYAYLTQCEAKLEESEVNGWVFGNLAMVSISGLLIDIANGYSNEPVDKVSLLDCDKVKAKQVQRVVKAKDCGDYIHRYNRSVYSFNDKKNKNTIHDLKRTQDYILEYCSDYVDLNRYKNQASVINKVYESYL